VGGWGLTESICHSVLLLPCGDINTGDIISISKSIFHYEEGKAVLKPQLFRHTASTHSAVLELLIGLITRYTTEQLNKVYF